MSSVLIASDHAGLELKRHLIRELPAKKQDLHFTDLGTFDESSVDYPDYAKKLAKELLEKKDTLGILICGSGQGMNIQANRFTGIRSALCWDIPSALLSRAHNNANVLCLGARLIPYGYATEIALTFLNTEFSGGRHEKRVKKLDQI